MHRFVIVVRVPNCASKLDGLERVGDVEALEAGDDVRVLAHDPQMVWEITRAEGGA